MVCHTGVSPVYFEDELRLVLSAIIFLLTIILSKIMVNKKPWDIAFWLCIALFFVCFGFYGYISNLIYAVNTLSYDGFIACGSFLTVVGVLFSKPRYVGFVDKILHKKTALFLSTFIVFAFINISTVNYDNDCIKGFWISFLNILDLLVYPLTFLFSLCAFLFRFSICVSAFAIYIVLFTIKSVISVMFFIANIGGNIILTSDVVEPALTIILCGLSIIILSRIKYLRKKNV